MAQDVRPIGKIRLFLLLTLLLVSLAACSQTDQPRTLPTPIPRLESRSVGGPRTAAMVRPQAAATTTPQAEAEPQPAALPPLLLESQPASGATWDGGPVLLIFDQPLAPGADAAFSVTPALAGDVAVAENRLTFAPSTAPVQGARYILQLDAGAAGSSGVVLIAPIQIELVAASPLAVTSTQPNDGSQEVSTDGQLTVIFNRPVVPLTGVAEQADLPQPLTLEPAVAGSGRWLNTSVYLFTPESGLAGATDYTATIAEVTGLNGERLAAPVTFSFTTANPIVLGSQPSAAQVRPDSTIEVIFSQAMDPESSTAAFQLVTYDERAPVAGEVTWSADGTTLAFEPEAPLTFGQEYQITVSSSAQPASRQGNLREGYQARFTVVPLPDVASTEPADGESNVSTATGVTIFFSAPLSPTLVLPNVDISPDITRTQVYSWYSEYDNRLFLNWDMEPRTRYTVTLGAGMEDPFGNSLGEDVALHFTTGDHAPFVQVSLDQFTHFSAFTSTHVVASYRNVAEIDASLYRLPLPELYKLTGEQRWELWDTYRVPNREANLIWERKYPAQTEVNEIGRQVMEIADDAGNLLPPGLYYLDVDQPNTTPNQGQDQRSRHVIILSSRNLVVKKAATGPSLAWLTDLLTGAPVGDQAVSFVSDGRQTGQAITNEDGVATTPLTQDPERPWMSVLAVSGQPGQADFAVASTDWNQGIGSWEFGIGQGYDLDSFRMAFYTDRPIYRPGQTIHWKGVVRAIDGERYQLPTPGQTVQVVVRDDRGNPVLEDEFALGAHGSLFGSVELAPEATTGFYYLEARLAGPNDRTYYGGVGFQVASYRKPEFEISVQPDVAEVIQGETIRFVVEASYFSGGPLAQAPVEWNLLAEPFFFSWSQQPANRYYSFDPYNPEEEVNPFGGYYGGLLQQGAGVTDKDGRLVVEIPADLAGALQSQRWTLDATVRSPTDQFVSGRSPVVVHRGEAYVGLSPRAYVSQVGQQAQIDVVVITPQGDPYPPMALEAVVYDYRWNSVYEQGADGRFHWTTSVERTPVYTETLQTDDQGESLLVWTPSAGGQYQIVASGQDGRGNAISSALYIWVSDQGADFVPWPQRNDDRLELVADKKSYQPGDEAQILVPSPFTGPVYALVTVERSGIVDQRVVILRSNSETLSVPITVDDIPNLFVSVILVKGVDETNPLPAMRVGMVQINVDVARKELTLGVEPSARTVRPGASVTYTVTVTDADGQPVPDTEISAALVDKAILTLANDNSPALVDVFYNQRPLGVQTGALLVINQDRLSQQLAEGAKGGGGGGFGAGLEIRQNFPDIAYWRADLLTDNKGQVTFAVDLPDNLTTWRLTLRAVTDDTLVGQTTDDIVATKELIIRPALPRFFTAGDRVQIGAVVQNNSALDLPNAILAIDVSGATLTGAGSVELNLPKATQLRQDWLIAVEPTVEVVTITLLLRPNGGATEAEKDGALPEADVVQVVLPVVHYETPEIVGTAGVVPPEGRLEAIRVPAAATESGSLQITLEPSLAAGMLDGLDYLRHYPYECNEQIVSSFLPNLFTVRALQTLGIQRPDLEKNLAFQLGVGLQRLVSRQNPDGGWGYWPREESTPFITAYVLWGLWNADQMGYPVSAQAFNRGAGYLESGLAAPKDVANDWRLNEMAFTHFVLAEMGQGDGSRMVTLYDQRERLGLYGRATLALALADMEMTDSAQLLLDDLLGQANLSATGAFWQEAGTDWQTLSTDTRTTSMVLAAFSRLRPDEPLLPNVVRWLMSARQAGRWQSTQETAWSLIGLTDWMAASGELAGAYDWSVTLNGVQLGGGGVNADNVDEPVTLHAAVADLIRDAANALDFQRSNASGQLYYTTFLRYFLDATAIPELDRGMVLARTFSDSKTGRPIHSAVVGDVVSVTLTIVAPQNRYHLLVEAPIPAGFEPIDPNLATSSDLYTASGIEPVDQPENPTWRTNWRFWMPTYTDMRDDRVAIFATYLPAGAYEYTFLMRASLPGEYRVLPAHAEQMYFPDIWGRSSGALFTVTR